MAHHGNRRHQISIGRPSLSIRSASNASTGGSRNALGLKQVHHCLVKSELHLTCTIHQVKACLMMTSELIVQVVPRVEYAEELAELLFATKVRKVPNQSNDLAPNTKVPPQEANLARTSSIKPCRLKKGAYSIVVISINMIKRVVNYQ
ncbi:hypothetical protein O9929_20190 [Vibrio lentus]|nr:hypothetical protein [Vibrio lentus]